MGRTHLPRFGSHLISLWRISESTYHRLCSAQGHCGQEALGAVDPVLFLGLCGDEWVRQGRASRLPLGVAGSSVCTSLGGMSDKLGDFSQEDPPSLLLFVADLIVPLSWSPVNRADCLGSCCQEARAGGPLPGAGGHSVAWLPQWGLYALEAGLAGRAVGTSLLRMESSGEQRGLPGKWWGLPAAPGYGCLYGLVPFGAPERWGPGSGPPVP